MTVARTSLKRVRAPPQVPTAQPVGTNAEAPYCRICGSRMDYRRDWWEPWRGVPTGVSSVGMKWLCPLCDI